ncbi:S8/S53 family peptidase [Rhizobium leguminosarum]|uniref:S8/S53 family peptidase n=1 Tax=Rhizobium leguminosarum TaxID=384 RepID=UPI001C93CEB3|nr:S8/S53 family peptidase [Rhizobium leguminosarum]MBY5326527.1 S8/S53 family peptidase [Rhizobium leguminosarum]
MSKLFVALTYALLLCSTGALAEGPLDQRIDWRSNNSVADGLPSAVEALTLGLYNIQSLTTKDVVAEQGVDNSSIQKIAVANYPFMAWTDSIDNILCDLNPTACERRRIPIETTGLETLGAYVSGFRVTSYKESHWFGKPGSVVKVPNIQFRVQSSWQDFSFEPSRRLSDLYSSQALGCTAIGGGDFSLNLFKLFYQIKREAIDHSISFCPKLIASSHQGEWSFLGFERSSRQNSPIFGQTNKTEFDSVQSDISNILKTADTNEAWSELDRLAQKVYSGVPSGYSLVRLPVLGLSSSFVIANSPTEVPFLKGSAAWEEFNRSLSTQRRIELLDAVNNSDVVLSVVGKSGSMGEKSGKADASITVAGVPMDDVLVSLQRDAIFKAINYDFERVESTPPVATSIVIIDDGLDKSLCVFAGKCKAKWLDKITLASLGGPFAPIVDEVNAEIADLKKSVGHGNGVAAVAVARPSNGMMVGIDPNATPILFPVQLGQWNFDNFAERVDAFVTNLFKEGGNPGLLVWNLSGHTKSLNQNQPIDKFLAKYKSKFPLAVPFFVFAAGNETQEVVEQDLTNEDCTTFPACRSRMYPNVITVVGAMLDANQIPTVWKDSTTGMMSYVNPDFEIAAMAKDIPIPSKTGKAFFSVDGTSYAAPQVAAIVSRLRSQMISPPEIVKARLIGCGRMSQGLVGRVKGGLLDADCTLRSNSAQVAFEPRPTDNVQASVAHSLRPAKLVGVWGVDRKKNQKATDIISISSAANTSISGDFRWWPAPNAPSILGIRQLVDKAGSFKFAVWDVKNAIKTEVRGPLDSTLVMEVLFEEDPQTTCIPVSNLLDFVPAAPQYAVQTGDQINEIDSRCADKP